MFGSDLLSDHGMTSDETKKTVSRHWKRFYIVKQGL
jgi:hypothetical protein